MKKPGHIESKDRKQMETKRANIIYFLNREGQIEHPHLIRIHHLSNSAVHLRDVKKWLSKLRGKDMPDSFSWSYQRRYKKRLLWQDLEDDDILTPISDGEYVLLGSLLSEAESRTDLFSSPELLSESVAEVKFSAENGQIDVGDGVLPEVVELKTSRAGDAGGPSNSPKHLRLFCNFLSCKAVDTVDSTQLASGGGGAKPAELTWSPLRLKNSHDDDIKRESEPMGGGKISRNAGRTRIPMPKCSHCEKPFNPEKLHSHMKSCKGLKPSGN